MSDEHAMDVNAEKRLFADVELIKQKQEHTERTMQNLLEEFISHSKTSNENLNKLTMSSHELVLETRSCNRRIDEIDAQFNQHVNRNEHDFRALGQRVATLENFKLETETVHRLTMSNRKWWSDNWHKILMVGVATIPLVVGLYEIYKKVTG